MKNVKNKTTTQYNFDNINLWRTIKFKHTAHSSNYDILSDSDNLITEYTGEIVKLRFTDNKPPLPIGDFSFSIWDFGLDKQLNNELIKIMGDYIELKNHPYKSIFNIINEGKLNLKTINKLVIIHSLIIHPSFRSKGVSQEFIEFIYKLYGDNDNNIILLNATPIQYNEEDFDYYNNFKSIEIKDDLKLPAIIIKAKEYYNFNTLSSGDEETDLYKIWGVASKCNFNHIEGTNIFILNKNGVLNRLLHKHSNFFKK
jgi:hypothetical protein